MNPFENSFTNIKKQENNLINSKPKLNYNFIEGAYVEISGGTDEYIIQFIDKQTRELVYQTKLQPNGWAKATRQYFVDWEIKIFKQNKLVTELNLNLFNRRVYIALDSKSLGDTIAWFPYVQQFQRKHDCQVVCSTFWNQLFDKMYPNIEFVKPGIEVKNILAMYKIGCFDFNKREYSPSPHNLGPLQKVANDILGLSFIEIKPKIVCFTNISKPTNKYVCIATQSTAQCKFWNNQDGWIELARWLKNNGLDVINLSINAPKIDGIINHPAGDIYEVIKKIQNCEFFCGLGSGLSWLAWALNKRVVLISGFSEPWTEFQSDCIRIYAPDNVCRGCWNWPGNVFDKNDFFWCPKHKNTSKHFECSKSITAAMVIKQIQTYSLL